MSRYTPEEDDSMTCPGCGCEFGFNLTASRELMCPLCGWAPPEPDPDVDRYDAEHEADRAADRYERTLP